MVRQLEALEREAKKRNLKLKKPKAPTTKARTPAYREFQQKYRNDPAGFARDCVKWGDSEGITPYQADILRALPIYRRVAVRGPHGLGKTAMAAIIIWWFALTREGEDWKIVTTASAWRQLTKYLWPEVHKWGRILDWNKIGRPPLAPKEELMTLRIKLSTGEAFAVASDVPEYIEGAHARQLLYLFDESKVIPDGTFDAAEGAFSGSGGDSTDEAYVVAISTPGDTVGRFYEIHKGLPAGETAGMSTTLGLEDWWVRHVTLEEAVAAGRISREWAVQRGKQWGTSSQVYQNRVLGEFCPSDEDGIVPLQWVELAQQRWEDWNDKGRQADPVGLGCDPADAGIDKTVIAPRLVSGRLIVIDRLKVYSKASTMQTTNRVDKLMETQNYGWVVVDVIGIGAGIADRLRELRRKVTAFNASEKATGTDKSGELQFRNKRAQGYWRTREMLDPEGEYLVALPPDEKLERQLTTIKWFEGLGGKIQVEAKDDIRKRLRKADDDEGGSTDYADAVMMALWGDAKPAPASTLNRKDRAEPSPQALVRRGITGRPGPLGRYVPNRLLGRFSR